MTRTRIAMLALLLVFCAPAFADALTVEKKTDIERLLEMTGALALAQQMSNAVVVQMTQALERARPDIPPSVLNVLPVEVDAVVKANIGSFKELVIPIYHKHFTGPEIKEMIRFYSTDLGKKTIRVMPMLVNESMQAGQKWGQSLAPEIQQRVRARLKKEGY